MKQSIKTGFGVVLTLFLYANFAMGVQTFGPKKYSRSDGSPNVYTDAFKTIAGIGKLIVRNGEYNGQKRVPYAISSARVFLNGTQIFGPNNFNNTVYCLMADINLNENNSITVELASQPGDFLTVSIEQQIPAPVIHSFLSSPENIAPGGSSILTWQTENATVCAIAPGIGNVEPSGSVSVSPSETTIYTLTASSPGGQATASATVTVAPLTISISSPVDGATIGKPDVMVQGNIYNPSGKEVGVTVNGVLALVDGNNFVANHVLLEQGENILTAVTTDANGNTSSASVTVNMFPAENYIRISADPASGVSPFETTLKVDGSFTFASQTPTCTGPGSVQITNGTEENEFIVNLTTPGIYNFTSTTQFEGQTYSDTVAAFVMDKEELDSLLQIKWNAMKELLIAGDIEKAIVYHQKAVHEKYTAIYNALGSELPVLAQQMNEISPVYFYDVLAKYRIRQDHDINSQIKTITYYIYFSKDENGIWRIENY